MKKSSFEWAKGLKADDAFIKKAIREVERDDLAFGLSLASKIAEQILSDDEDDTVKILEAYLDADDDEKAIIDGLLASLTGWSLGTLLCNMGITPDLAPIKVGRQYKIGKYEAVCVKVEGNEAIMQSLGMTSGEWPGEGYIGEYDDVTRGFVKDWEDVLNIFRLPALTDDIRESRGLSYQALTDAASRYRKAGARYTSVWFGDKDGESCAFSLNKEGRWDIKTPTAYSLIVAPEISLDLTKITLDGNEIRLSSDVFSINNDALFKTFGQKLKYADIDVYEDGGVKCYDLYRRDPSNLSCVNGDTVEVCERGDGYVVLLNNTDVHPTYIKLTDEEFEVARNGISKSEEDHEVPECPFDDCFSSKDVFDVVVRTREELEKVVTNDYNRYDTEFNSLYFDLNVKMPEKEILEAYSHLAYKLNGDTVSRYEGDKIQETLIPEGEYNGFFEGNCKDFLESFNGQDRFRRYFDGERLDFIF